MYMDVHVQLHTCTSVGPTRHIGIGYVNTHQHSAIEESEHTLYMYIKVHVRNAIIFSLTGRPIVAQLTTER